MFIGLEIPRMVHLRKSSQRASRATPNEKCDGPESIAFFVLRFTPSAASTSEAAGGSDYQQLPLLLCCTYEPYFQKRRPLSLNNPRWMETPPSPTERFS